MRPVKERDDDWCLYITHWLVAEPTQFEKYARQIGNLPQIVVKIKIFETTT